MKKIASHFQFCAIFLSLSFVMPSDSFKQRVLDRIKSFHTTFPIEKVYVHTDKPYYVLGENIWFKAYLVDGMNHQFEAPSNNLYVDLLNPEGKVAKAITLRNTSEGIAGDFALDDGIESGIYILRAYTRSMKNFPDHFIFQKEIRIYDKQKPGEGDNTSIQNTTLQNIPKFEIQFFPEGGDLINGLTSKVGFKAVGENGNGIAIEGNVLDDEGELITTFKSLKFGLGVFNLTPVSGKKYSAEITYNGIKKEVVLPEAKTKGFTIQYFPGRNNTFYVVLQSNQAEGLKGALLYGHSRGSSFVAESITTTVDKATYEISMDSIEEGIAHLTLFSQQGIPVCERLIFISKPKHNSQLVAHTNRPSYSNRSKVKLKLQLEAEEKSIDVEGAGLSVSITDQALVTNQLYGLDIRSYLLLTSELKGRIEQPSYYFDPLNSGTDFLLDLLMMTQGWRRFTWDQLLAKKSLTVQFLPEQSFTIAGQITKIGEADKPLRANVFFNTLDDNLLTGETITGEDGKFAFTGLTFIDTTTVILRANRYREPKKNKKKKKSSTSSPSGNQNVAIQLDKPHLLQISSEGVIPYYHQPERIIDQYLKTQQDIDMIDAKYQHKTINLDEVTIEARKVPKKEQLRQPGQLYAHPDHRLVLDSLGPVVNSYPSIFELIRSQFPGVQVQGVPPNQQILIRGITSLTGSNSARFVLDGVMLADDGINSIRVEDVAYIDVLKSAKAAVYGSLAANGIIAVYTKKSTNEKPSASSGPRIGIIDFKHPGYYKAREFYQPNYDKKLPEHVKPDIRTTLYWNPKVRTDKTGNVELYFYTDDKKSTYQVDVQGITRNGTPLSAKTVFVVE